MKKKENRRRNRYARPVLGALGQFLKCFFLLLAVQTVVQSLTDNEDMGTVAAILAAVLALLLFTLSARRDGFRGFLRGNAKLGLLLLIPAFIYSLAGLFFASRGFTLSNFLLAVMAGVFEEAVFRAIPIAFMMRAWEFDEKKIPAVLLITAVTFGAFHITNVFSGASLKVSLIQAAECVAVGCLFGAIFLRSGNILPLMLDHFLQDVIAFLNGVSNTDGVMNDLTWTPDVILDAVVVPLMLVLGLWYVRKEKRGEISELWKGLWSWEKETEDSAPEE